MTTPQAKDSPGTGMAVPHVFARADGDPFDAVAWDSRRAEITDERLEDGLVACAQCTHERRVLSRARGRSGLGRRHQSNVPRCDVLFQAAGKCVFHGPG